MPGGENFHPNKNKSTGKSTLLIPRPLTTLNLPAEKFKTSGLFKPTQMAKVIDFDPNPVMGVTKTHRREKYFTDEYALFGMHPTDDGVTVVCWVTLRLYSGNGLNTACCWIRSGTPNRHSDNITGVGKASVWQEALKKSLVNAGFKFEGSGGDRPQDYLEAIAQHLELPAHFIHHANA